MKPGDRILDLGSGEGRHTHHLSYIGQRVLSADLDREELSNNRQRWLGLRGDSQTMGHADFMVADGDRLPFPDNTFDHIVCTEVVEHVPDPRVTLRELWRVLKPGGNLAVSTPATMPERACWTLSWEYWHAPGGHVRIFRPGQLGEIVREADFRLFGIRHKHALHSLWWILRCAFGLPNERAIVPRIYLKAVIEPAMFRQSKFWDRVERVCDWFFPKSVVVYGRKPREAKSLAYQEPERHLAEVAG
ncbi:MAG: class I SAM-dependent methyltransferase [Dehalococcoidia bacterium]